MVAEMASAKAKLGTVQPQPTAEDQRQQQEQQPSSNNDADPKKGNDAEMKEETVTVPTEDGNESKRRKVEGMIPSKVTIRTTDSSPSPPPPSSSSSSSPPVKSAPATIQTKNITTTTEQQQKKQQPTTMAAASGTSDMEIDEYSDLGLTSSDEEDTPDARAGRLCSNLEGLLKVSIIVW